MTDMKNWIKNWRATASKIEVDMEHSITSISKGWKFEILSLRHYSKEYCHGNPLTTSANYFDERVGLLSRLTRDAGTSRIITVDDEPRFLLYQGSDALYWRAQIEKTDDGLLLRADRSGSSWRLNLAIRKSEFRDVAEKKERDEIIRSELAVVNEIRRSLKYKLLSDFKKHETDE